MRSLLLLFLALLGGCTERTPTAPPAPRWVRSQNSGLGTVVSIEPVHIDGGFQVWRNGQPLTVQDGLVIRLGGVGRMDAFMPQAITPPLFVLGDTVGVVLANPIESVETVLLVAAPPPDTEVALWMTEPGVEHEELVGIELQTAQSKALSAGAHDGINIRTPPAGTPKTSYADEALMEAIVLGRKAPELCARLGKQCGFPRTMIGVVDCGTCPTGQVCTTDYQCCTPGADAGSCPRPK